MSSGSTEHLKIAICTVCKVKKIIIIILIWDNQLKLDFKEHHPAEYPNVRKLAGEK